MSTIHDPDRTTIQDPDKTGFAPRAQDATVASAWSSSPLGEPAADAAETECFGDYPGYLFDDPGTPATSSKSVVKTAVAAGVIGTVGVGAALGIVLFGTSARPHAVTVAAGGTGVSSAVPAIPVPAQPVNPPDSGPAPAVVLPDNDPAPAAVVNPAPVIAQPVELPPPAPVAAPPGDVPPPAGPGVPPAAAPGPVVMVNIAPPPIAVVQAPQLPAPPKLPAPPAPPKLPAPPAPPKLPSPPKPPVLCLPPHHLVGGVCK